MQEVKTMKKTNKLIAGISLAVLMAFISISSSLAKEPTNDQTYYFDKDKLYKIDKDKGFSLDEQEKIKENDVHYGWSLGSFYVTGYTQRTEDKKGHPVFLKNAGDKVVLGFDLEQKANKLNGDKTLSIAYDKKGYDEYFQIKKTKFKRGALIIRHTDYQNNKKKPQLYTNYLSAKAKVNANTKVEINEEGDYEVALDYTVKSAPRKILNKEILPSTSDYTIRLFKFSVRNGNSMIFPFDAETGEELVNKSFTKNGFRIDLAKSHYLKVFVRRDVLEGEGVEDTRENKPAKDGAVYTEEGVYTITVEDPSTEQTTEKQIYVGTDDRYKALVTTGLSLDEIDKRIANGETIGEDGNFVTVAAKADASKNLAPQTAEDDDSGSLVGPILVLIIVLIIVGFVLHKKRKKKMLAKDNPEEKQNE